MCVCVCVCCSLFMWVQPEITQKLYIGLWVAFISSCVLPYKLMGFILGKYIHILFLPPSYCSHTQSCKHLISRYIHGFLWQGCMQASNSSSSTSCLRAVPSWGTSMTHRTLRGITCPRTPSLKSAATPPCPDGYEPQNLSLRSENKKVCTLFFGVTVTITILFAL